MPDFIFMGDVLQRLLPGIPVLLQLVSQSLAAGFVIAILVALMRLSPVLPLRWIASTYVFLFRGTPLLVQIFLIYYGAGQFSAELRELGLWDGMFREAYFCAVLTLVLNTTAYSAEIIRGGIQNVPHGEIEAARACGMSGSLLYRRIILPKAARIALPAYSNEVVFLFQATSLVSVITLLDLAGVARDVIADTFRTFEVWTFTLLCYVALSYGIFWIFKRLERRLMRHLQRRPAAQPAAKAAT